MAVYLITCRYATSIGIYYLPEPILQHEAGLSAEEVTSLWEIFGEADLDFARYNREREEVFVPAMAGYQVGETLKPHDNRIKWLQGEMNDVADSPFLPEFLARYGKSFHLLPPSEAPSKGVESPSEAKGSSSSSSSSSSKDREAWSGETGAPADEEVEGTAKISKRAGEIWQIYLAERRACLDLLGRRHGVEPSLTAPRARKIDSLCADLGEDHVRAAPLGLRHSPWHLGKKDGVLRLAPENVFHVTSMINQVEILADLHARHAAGESVVPINLRRGERTAAGACDSLAKEAEELDRAMGFTS